jgi:hypothetical protein
MGWELTLVIPQSSNESDAAANSLFWSLNALIEHDTSQTPIQGKLNLIQLIIKCDINVWRTWLDELIWFFNEHEVYVLSILRRESGVVDAVYTEWWS